MTISEKTGPICNVKKRKSLSSPSKVPFRMNFNNSGQTGKTIKVEHGIINN